MEKKCNNTFLHSLLISVILMNGLFCAILQYNFNIKSNSNLYILILEISIIAFGFFRDKGTIKINMTKLYFLLYILIQFMLLNMNNSNLYTFPQLIFYAVLPFLCFNGKEDGKEIIEFCMIISLLVLLCYNNLFSFQYEGYNQISMGNSYVVSIPVIAAIIHFFLYFDKKRKIFNLIYLYELFLLIRLMFLGSRGAILSVFFTIFLMIVRKINKNNKKDKKYMLKKIFIYITYLIIFIGIIYYKELFELLCMIFDKLFGTVPSFLNKSVTLMEDGNLNNNRTTLYDDAIKLILDKPVLGYGMRTFSLYTIYPWPHNLIIQLLFECGIVFSIIPLWLIIKSIYKIISCKGEEYSNYIFLTFLTLLIIPRLLLSNDIWLVPYLWCFLGYCSMFYSYNKKKKGELYEKVIKTHTVS